MMMMMVLAQHFSIRLKAADVPNAPSSSCSPPSNHPVMRQAGLRGRDCPRVTRPAFVPQAGLELSATRSLGPLLPQAALCSVLLFILCFPQALPSVGSLLVGGAASVSFSLLQGPPFARSGAAQLALALFCPWARLGSRILPEAQLPSRAFSHALPDSHRTLALGEVL